jgi:RpiB/LacA/LacB family sugar-phosphate isomerase
VENGPEKFSGTLSALRPLLLPVPIRVSLAGDHRGVSLRPIILDFCEKSGFPVIDHGTSKKNSVDYPLYAHKVVADLLACRADFGVLVCWTGIGMCMAANRFHGVRAALACSGEMAEISRRHSHANVLCIGSRWQDVGVVAEILRSFFLTAPEPGRHRRRIEQLEKGVD